MKNNNQNKQIKPKAILNMLEDLEETNSKLKEEKNFVESILEHAGIPVFGFTMEGKLFIANKKFLSMTGYVKEEIDTKEKLFKNIFPSPMVSNKLDKALVIIEQGKEVVNFVIPLRCKNDTTIIVVCNIVKLENSKDKKAGYVMFMRDISEIFELEKQIRYWAANGFTQTNRPNNDEETDVVSGSRIEISGQKANTNKGKTILKR